MRSPAQLVPRAAGPFNYPTELVPSPSGDLYVSDGYRNARIHRFDNDGNHKFSWGKPGKEHPYEFHLPHSLLVTRDDRVYVCDRENSRLQVFNTSGDFIAMWTDAQRPTDIAETPEGDFVVSELATLDNSKPAPASASSTATATSWPAGTAAPPTASGATPTATSSSPSPATAPSTNTAAADPRGSITSTGRVLNPPRVVYDWRCVFLHRSEDLHRKVGDECRDNPRYNDTADPSGFRRMAALSARRDSTFVFISTRSEFISVLSVSSLAFISARSDSTLPFISARSDAPSPQP